MLHYMRLKVKCVIYAELAAPKIFFYKKNKTTHDFSVWFSICMLVRASWWKNSHFGLKRIIQHTIQKSEKVFVLI